MINNSTNNQPQKCELLVVLPVGPDNNGADTIESIFAYCTKSVIILAVDDSKDTATADFLDTVDSRVIRLPAAGFVGIRGALFCSLARAYKYALAHYNFDIVLRIDTDALVIGDRPEADAYALFKSDPRIGMLGSYRFGYDGNPRDFKIVAKGIFKETSFFGLRNASRRNRLRSWIRVAKANQYETGEHCLGAAIFMRADVLRKMSAHGNLEVDEFYDSVISEDHLFSLLTIVHGYKLADFVTGNLPMGVKWRGLPDSPENLLKKGKKIVHSIKFYEDLNETDIRRFFKESRLTDDRVKS